MRTPTPAQLLQVWERGGEQSATACGLLLLATCCEDRAVDSLAALPLGRRDALLLALRARLFGDEVDSVAVCPQCTATVEASFRCGDLLMTQDAVSHDGAIFEHLATSGVLVRFRLPDSNDLLALESCADAQAARQMLLGRCVVDLPGAGDLAALPALQAEIAQAMAGADPQADLQLAFTCPGCAFGWQPMFDIARFLWQELHAWALRMLRDVDTLARSYHWTEEEILALSPRRRQAYLELCAP
jgi:hypothetical protein